jgi:hypothetical protein
LDRGNNQRDSITGKTSTGIAACSGKNRRFNRLFRIIPFGQEYAHDHVNIEQFAVKRHKNMDNYRLDDDIQAKIFAFAFRLSAEIEQNLISQRTKEALARKKSEGCKLGRPKGNRPALQKLSEHDTEIQSLLGGWLTANNNFASSAPPREALLPSKFKE